MKIITVILVVVHVLMSVALPLVVTYDGHLYHGLLQSFGSGFSLAHWDVVRTPLFPLMLYISTNVFGVGPASVIILNTSLYLIAGLALIQRCMDVKSSVVFSLLFFLAPLSLVYEHILLSEMSLVLAFTLVIIFLSKFNSTYISALLVGGSVVFSYYVKPSFLYLAVVLLILLLVAHFIAFFAKRFFVYRIFGLLADRKLLICISLAVLAMLPWQFLISKSGRLNDVKAFFFIKHLTVDVDYFSNPKARELYSALKQKYEFNLPQRGASDFLVYPIAENMSKLEKEKIMAHAWGNNFKYTARRAFLTLWVLTFDNDSENEGFANAVLVDRANGLNKIYQGPEGLCDIIKSVYSGPAFPSMVGRMLSSMMPVYRYINIFVVLSIPLVIVTGFYFGNRFLFWYGILAGLYLLMHAVGLLSINRYAFPIYPAGYFSITLLGQEIINLIKKRRTA
jgi:hypothetical protein